MLKLALTASALALLTLPAFSAEFKGGGEPAFRDLGISLSARKVITGLAKARAFVVLTASANVSAECLNPDSGHTKPTNQTPEPITVIGTSLIGKNRISPAGNGLMVVTTNPPALEVEGSPDCNSHDTEVITDLAFTDAEITIRQPRGTVVLSASCTFSSPTSDGVVPGANVTCVLP
jgi:hypothetical protein